MTMTETIETTKRALAYDATDNVLRGIDSWGRKVVVDAEIYNEAIDQAIRNEANENHGTDIPEGECPGDHLDATLYDALREQAVEECDDPDGWDADMEGVSINGVSIADEIYA